MDQAEGPSREVSGPFEVEESSWLNIRAPYICGDTGWLNIVEGKKNKFKFFQRRCHFMTG